MADKPPLDLARARVLISNDDGINAPGLKVLERVLVKIAREVWVVAPEIEQSAASHSLTLRRPLRVRKISRHRFAVNGTPTDCVLLAGRLIMKDHPPDLVLAGINRGANLGDDVTYSGTVAAAMEAALLGCRSVALSQIHEDRRKLKWATAAQWTGEVLRCLTSMSWPTGILINVNFPDVPARSVTGIEVTHQGSRKIGDELVEGVDPRGEPYFWIGAQRTEDRYQAGSDLEAVSRGAITVTPLSLDLTHRASMKALKAVFR